ncbi:T4-like baseplate wedge [Synechococcus phage S-CRM01]|uniref:baseplate wedge subunit n=1 Tax=Synechococcus phage S-CRM01 TaxID=1026955 RepID=UPI000209E32B|nr:baseplate wedge subunit [Synechococcus phage S-CRM01]AEC52950.1 T4-like baseplate wedge [Synechococcus phage S-CRM01]
MPELTRQTKAFVDISLDFTPNPMTGDLVTLKNERSINNSIRNLIYISPPEVPFRADVGSNVRNSLFENIDQGTAGVLSLEIERTIRYNEPRVKLIDVQVDADEDRNSLSVTIKYQIVGYDTIFEVKEILKPTR